MLAPSTCCRLAHILLCVTPTQLTRPSTRRCSEDQRSLRFLCRDLFFSARSSWEVRIRWARSYLLWRMSNEREPSERPTIEAALQGSTGVVGVDGLPVVVVRTSPSETGQIERQLSYNCPRYITVGGLSFTEFTTICRGSTVTFSCIVAGDHPKLCARLT